MKEIFIIYRFGNDDIVAVKYSRKEAMDYLLMQNNPLLYYFQSISKKNLLTIKD